MGFEPTNAPLSDKHLQETIALKSQNQAPQPAPTDSFSCRESLGQVDLTALAAALAGLSAEDKAKLLNLLEGQK